RCPRPYFFSNSIRDPERVVHPSTATGASRGAVLLSSTSQHPDRMARRRGIGPKIPARESEPLHRRVASVLAPFQGANGYVRIGNRGYSANPPNPRLPICDLSEIAPPAFRLPYSPLTTPPPTSLGSASV